MWIWHEMHENMTIYLLKMLRQIKQRNDPHSPFFLKKQNINYIVFVKQQQRREQFPLIKKLNPE